MKNITYTGRINFEAYGVTIGVQVSDTNAIDKIKKILPFNSRPLSADAETEYTFSLIWGEDGTREDVLYREDEEVARRIDPERLVALLDTCIRMTIGEFAPHHIFIHAGVVGWKGEALIFPAKSYSGKTTLVAELIKHGAEYYSDEYAVIDESGLVHPYPKDLSLRKEGEFQQTDRSVEELGGVQAIQPIPVRLVFLTEFDPEADWDPKILPRGQGLMQLLPHALGLRYNPEFVFKLLNLIAERAIIASSKRGEASDFASRILHFA
ncbi:MAG TPA: hypothetical protein VGO50_16055 [Pyrinomonadaceae bacterium]|jgi:hypothetical protein|nr:hypothetical protein [Pyrinomonadaceae bacterium]